MYLQKLPENTRAVLFDKTRCWLIRNTKNVGRIDELYWTVRGSERMFLNFIVGALNPWAQLLSSACQTMNVRLVDRDAFLGAGATGRVFKVKLEDDEFAALKIVPQHISLLQTESSALASASETGVVATVIKPFKEIDNGSGAAIVISPVGEPVVQSNLTEDCVLKIAKSLFKLHSNGFQHGDPRLANIILHEGQYLWIDFMACVSDSDFAWTRDACILARSILNLSVETDIPEEIYERIRDYATNKNEYSCEQFAANLWRIIHPEGV